MREHRFGLLAPWLCSANLGDHVIGDAVTQELHRQAVVPEVVLPTHRRPTAGQLLAARSVDALILGGTNALSSTMEKHRQFWLTPDLVRLYAGKVVLFGAGWWQYQEGMSAYSRWALRKVLRPDVVHGVRDAYTAKKLEQIGIRSQVVGCPTMWRIEPFENGDVDSFVVTVTDYHRAAVRDQSWLDAVRAAGRPVVLQPMSLADIHYATHSLGWPLSEISTPRLTDFDRLLTQNVGYVGTRLHAGIRALQAGRPATILGIDNRAIEMARSFALPVIPVEDFGDPGAGLPVGGDFAAPMTPEQVGAAQAWLSEALRGLPGA